MRLQQREKQLDNKVMLCKNKHYMAWEIHKGITVLYRGPKWMCEDYARQRNLVISNREQPLVAGGEIV